MTEWFPSDLGRVGDGVVVDLRAKIACEIVRHCALVTGFPDGEDTAGRQKLGLLPARDVALRAVDIADALVEAFESRQWIRKPVMTLEEDWAEAGRLTGIKQETSYNFFAKSK